MYVVEQIFFLSNVMVVFLLLFYNGVFILQIIVKLKKGESINEDDEQNKKRVEKRGNKYLEIYGIKILLIFIN